MKYLFLSILPILFFTGCSFSCSYNEGYISQSIEKNYKKVDSIEIGIISSKAILSRQDENTALEHLTLDLETGAINEKIAINYFSQYFNKVLVSGSVLDNGIYVDNKIIDYSFKFDRPGDGSSIKMTILSKVFKNGKIILDKKYNLQASNNVLITFVGISSPLNGLKELFHKTLFNFYENEFKQDLLNAL